MRRRIFIAINLPKDIKKELEVRQNKIEEMFSGVESEGMIRWTKKDNLHITLIFLGYLTDQEILEICEAIRETAPNYKSFLVKLSHICYGPPKKMPPKMVWAMGERSKELTDLKDGLEKSLTASAENQISTKNFSPHITMGRIKAWQWKRIEPEERPAIETDFSLSFPVESIEIMESELKRGGPQYNILESISFSK